MWDDQRYGTDSPPISIPSPPLWAADLEAIAHSFYQCPFPFYEYAVALSLLIYPDK